MKPNGRSHAACALSLALAAGGSWAEAASTYNFHWAGNGGYQIDGSLSFDAAASPAVIAESGAGPLLYLQSMQVSFFDPGHHLLQSAQPIVGGVSDNPFFRLSFDTSSKQLTGSFVISGTAGGSSGYFAFGSVGSGSYLYNAATFDPTAALGVGALDFNDSTAFTTTPAAVPELGGLPLMLAGLAALGLARRRRTAAA